MLKSRSLVLLFALVCLLACGPEPTPRPFPTLPAPPPVQVNDPGWSEVSIETLCLDIRQEFATPTGLPIEVSLPVQQVLEPFLDDLGLEVVLPSSGSGSPEGLCDATLSVLVTGQSIIEQYQGPGPCHDGAEGRTEIVLSASGHDALVFLSSDAEDPRERVEFCRKAAEAPFNLLDWREGMLEAMIAMWGPTAYGPALVHMGWPPEDERLGTSIVPDLAKHVPAQARSDAVDYTIRALRSKDDVVRHRALVIMGALASESDAERLVPALLEAFKRERNLSFRGDMLSIMSQVTGESHPDADAWFRWWQKQG